MPEVQEQTQVSNKVKYGGAAGVGGAVMTALMSALFMGDWRAALIVGLPSLIPVILNFIASYQVEDQRYAAVWKALQESLQAQQANDPLKTREL